MSAQAGSKITPDLSRCSRWSQSNIPRWPSKLRQNDLFLLLNVCWCFHMMSCLLLWHVVHNLSHTKENLVRLSVTGPESSQLINFSKSSSKNGAFGICSVCGMYRCSVVCACVLLGVGWGGRRAAKIPFLSAPQTPSVCVTGDEILLSASSETSLALTLKMVKAMLHNIICAILP